MYSATDASSKWDNILWISLGFMWICPYPLSHFFSINVWEYVQLSTKKVLFHRPERTEGRFICIGVLINGPLFLGC